VSRSPPLRTDTWRAGSMKVDEAEDKGESDEFLEGFRGVRLHDSLATGGLSHAWADEAHAGEQLTVLVGTLICQRMSDTPAAKAMGELRADVAMLLGCSVRDALPDAFS